MPNHFANRRSPSGPRISQQAPYFNTAPNAAAGTFYVPIASGPAVAAPAGTEYSIPSPGKLDTLQITNNLVGADAVDAVYQARKNGANVGSPVTIPNNAVGPFKVDLSAINVLAGDLVSISVTTLGFGGAAPTARVLFTWSPSTAA